MLLLMLPSDIEGFALVDSTGPWLDAQESVGGDVKVAVTSSSLEILVGVVAVVVEVLPAPVLAACRARTPNGSSPAPFVLPSFVILLRRRANRRSTSVVYRDGSEETKASRVTTPGNIPGVVVPTAAAAVAVSL